MAKILTHPEHGFRDTRAQDQQRAPATSSRWKYWLIAGAILLALLILQPLWRWLATGGQSVRASELRFATVQRADFIADVSGYAQVVAARAPSLFASAAGTVRFAVNAGDSVKKDQPLAEIDSPELLARLAQERSTLDSARADAAQARIDNQREVLARERLRDEAMIRATAAEREFQRAERAFAKGAMSEVDHLRAGDLLKAAGIETAHADAELALERKSLALQLQNRMAQVAKQELVVAELQRQHDSLTLRAPFDGIVGDLLQVDRAAVPLNGPVLTIVDLSAFELDLSLSELYAQRLTPGLEATVERAGQNYTAQIKRVSPEITNGQIKVRAAFTGAQPADLKQNQRVFVRVQLDRREQVLTVARGAYLDELGGKAIWVRDQDALQLRRIELGLIGADRVEVLQGLKQGEEVAISVVRAESGVERLHLHR